MSVGRASSKKGGNASPYTLTAEQIKTLCGKMAAGDLSARENLIIGHLWIVEHLVPSYLCSRVPYDDLYQEGCYGLICAIDHYDVTRGTQISTFAAYYVKKYLRRACFKQSQTLPITVGEKFFWQFQKYQQAVSILTVTLKRAPTSEEIADETNISIRDIRSLGRFAYAFTTFDAAESGAFGTGCTSQSAECTVMGTAFSEELPALNVKLDEREEQVIREHFGFTKAGNTKSYREIGRDMGISSETVRKSLVSALTKIKEANIFRK